MASSTSFPDPRSKKPLGKMADWFRQALSKKPTTTHVSPENRPSGISQSSSQDSPPPLGPSSEVSPTLPPTHMGADSSSSGRWSKDYDVCVCHSEEDLAVAQELVSYLEGSTSSLRCFLQLRDATPGGAIVSELCQALSNSHCRVLLITPGFLQDPWCRSSGPQLTLLLSPQDPESWSKAGNGVREPRALQGLAFLCSMLYVTLGSDCPWPPLPWAPSKAPGKLGTPPGRPGEAGDSPRKATRKLGTPPRKAMGKPESRGERTC